MQLPVPGKAVLFLDVGANVEVRAQHLVQFAFLGAAFSEAVLGVERPRVGLLSVGEEAGKGREEVAAAHETLSAAKPIKSAATPRRTRSLLDRRRNAAAREPAPAGTGSHGSRNGSTGIDDGAGT